MWSRPEGCYQSDYVKAEYSKSVKKYRAYENEPCLPRQGKQMEYLEWTPMNGSPHSVAFIVLFFIFLPQFVASASNSENSLFQSIAIV